MTNFWYAQDTNEPIPSQSSWEGGFLSCELPIPFSPPKKMRRRDPQDQYGARQSWCNQSLWPAPQSTTMQHCSTSMTSSAYTDPGLSSHNTSRRSSINPPPTPNDMINICIPTRRTFLPPDNAKYRTEGLAYPNDQYEQQQLSQSHVAIDQSFIGQQFSASTYPSDGFASSMPDVNWLDTIHEQPAESSFATITHRTSQQLTTLPSHWSAEPSPCTQPSTGAWQMNVDSSWPLCDDETLPRPRASHAYHHGFGSATSSHSLEGSSEDVSFQQQHITSHARNKSTIKEYRSVECEHCSNVFTGKYGMGNMRRHVRLKHLGELPKEYVCPVCRRSYNRSDALGNHQRSKHPTFGAHPI